MLIGTKGQKVNFPNANSDTNDTLVDENKVSIHYDAVEDKVKEEIPNEICHVWTSLYGE